MNGYTTDAYSVTSMSPCGVRYVVCVPLGTGLQVFAGLLTKATAQVNAAGSSDGSLDDHALA